MTRETTSRANYRLTSKDDAKDDAEEKKMQSEAAKLYRKSTRLRALYPDNKEIKKIAERARFLLFPKKMRKRLTALGLDPDSKETHIIEHR